MPLYRVAGFPSVDELALQAASTWTERPSPLAPEPPSTGFFKSFYLGAALDSLTGSATRRLGFAWEEESYAPDPGFNPYDKLTEDFARQYPFTLEDFESGRVLDLRNESEFWHYVTRKKVDYDERLEATRGSLLGYMAGAVVPDLALTAGVGRLVMFLRGGKAIPTLRAIATSSRAHKAAIIGSTPLLMGATNVGWEGGLEAINPDRNVDLEKAILIAAVMGASIGLLIPVARGAARGTGRALLSTRAFEGLQQRVAREIADAGRVAQVESVVEAHTKSLRDMLERETPDGPRSVMAIRSPQTQPLLEQLRLKWAEAGHELTVVTDPQQPAVDWLLGVSRLDEALQGAQPHMGSGPMGLIARTMQGVPGTPLQLPAVARRSASYLARKAVRTFFIDSTLTLETKLDPLTARNNPSAEALRFNMTWLKEQAGESIDTALTGHFKSKAGPIDVTLSDGSRVTVSRFGHRQRFGRIVKDLIHQEDELRRGLRSKLSFEPPAAVREAAEAWRHYSREMLERAEEAGRLKGPRALARAQEELQALESQAAALDGADPPALARAQDLVAAKAAEVRQIETWIENAESYVTRRWLRHEILRNREGFMERLVAQWQKNRRVDRRTGKAIVPEDEEVLEGALRQTDSTGAPILTDADREILRNAVTLGDALRVDPTLRARYDLAAESYLREQARKTTDLLTDAGNAHGIEQAFAGGNVFKERTLQIDEGNFREFLDNDLLTILNVYDHKVGGDLAARIAIRRDEGFWGPLVKAATGEDLAKHAGDPQLVLRAVDEDFRELMDAARRADPDGKLGLQRMVEQSRNQTARILAGKLDELLGHHIGDPAAEAGWKAAGRIALRLPFMSFMGRMAVSSMSDVAGYSLAARTTPQMLQAIGRGFLGMLPGMKIPRRGLEALEVASDEGITRTLALHEIEDLPMDPRLATSAGGRLMARLDRGTDWMARKFGTATLMNRWNTVQRRVTAHLVMQEIVRGARLVAKADALRAAGVPADEALRRAGLAVQDAQRLSRLGFTPERSRRLLQVLRQHGQDYHGRPLRELSEEEWQRFGGQISPEYQAWYKDDVELFDVLTSAVNTEVRNIIVEPTLLSRPLMNQRWLGRLVNQFWAFGYAWGNQLAPTAAQRPVSRQAALIMLAVGMGGVSDAVHNHLSGRRELQDTARLWGDKPAAMLVTASERAGLFGWLSRPNAVLLQAGVSPQQLLGNEISSLHGARSLNYAGAVGGPAIDYWNRVGNALFTPALPGNEYDARAAHMLRTTLPYQNWIGASAVYRFTKAAGLDNPLGPGRGIDPFLTQPYQDARPPRRDRPDF